MNSVLAPDSATCLNRLSIARGTTPSCPGSDLPSIVCVLPDEVCSVPTSTSATQIPCHLMIIDKLETHDVPGRMEGTLPGHMRGSTR